MNDAKLNLRPPGPDTRWEKATSAPVPRGVPLLALLLALLTMAGCSVAGSGARGAADPAPTFDRSPSAVVFSVSDIAPYNPSDQQSSSGGVEIHGDGSVKGGHVAPGKKVTEEQMQQLAKKAAELGLLDEPDLGDRVYDAGETDVYLTLNGKKVSLAVSSSGMGSYSEAQKAARQAVRDFAALVYRTIA